MNFLIIFCMLGVPTLTYSLTDTFDPQSLEIIKKNDPFKSKVSKQGVKEQRTCSTAVESKLPVSLINTSVLSKRESSVAQFKIETQIKELREGEELLPGVVINEIQRLQVFIILPSNICEVIRKNELK